MSEQENVAQSKTYRMTVRVYWEDADKQNDHHR